MLHVSVAPTGLMIRSAVATRAARPSLKRRIALLGDLGRITLQDGGLQVATHRNVVWLRELLMSVPALQAPDVELDLLQPASAESVDESFLGGSVVADAYRAHPLAAWASRFDTPRLDVFPRLLERATEADLVVGHELPPSIKRHLHARGRRYISFHVHALRMLRDLCLGATTNCPTVAKALAREAVSESEVHAQVHRFRALCRFHHLPAFAFPEGLPVLVGQTEHDSVLLQDGRFIDWHDREDALDVSLRDFDEIIFIEHPFRPDSRRVTEYLRCRHGKTVIATTANGYGLLLSAPDVPKVVTLSSSLGVEAAAFGWPAEFLLADPREKLQVRGVDVEFDAPLGHGVLSDVFWRDVLDGAPPRTRRASEVRTAQPFLRGDNYLRDSLESWSYRLLRQGLAGAHSRKTLMVHSRLESQRQRALLRSLLSPLSGQSSAPGLPAAPGVELLSMAAPVQPGPSSVLRGGQPAFAQALGPGFHPAEGWGAWSSQHRCELWMAVAPPAAGGLLRLSLDIGGFEGTVAKSPVLTLSVEGRTLGLALLRSPDAHAAHITVVLPVKPGLVRLCIDSTHVTSPKETGLGADARQLGFALTAIECELRSPQDAEYLRLAAAPRIWGLPLPGGGVRDALQVTT